jgi:hypothetical protein
MPSRWGYEALVTTQFTTNRYQSQFFAEDCSVRMADYLANHYLHELRGLADYPFLDVGSPDRTRKTAQAMRILSNELPRLAASTGEPLPEGLAVLNTTVYTRSKQKAIKAFLDNCGQIIWDRRREASKRIEAKKKDLRAQLGAEGLAALKRGHYNREIAKLALDLQSLEDLRLGHSRIVQLALPACQAPESHAGRAHFLAAFKQVGPFRIPTLTFNLSVLVLMALLLYTALYFSLLNRVLESWAALLNRLRRSGRPAT